MTGVEAECPVFTRGLTIGLVLIPRKTGMKLELFGYCQLFQP